MGFLKIFRETSNLKEGKQCIVDMEHSSITNMFMCRVYLEGDNIRVMQFFRSNKKHITFYEAFHLMQDANDEFRLFLTKMIVSVPYKAIFWECPPVNKYTIRQEPFQFAVVEAKNLVGRTINGAVFNIKPDEQKELILNLKHPVRRTRLFVPLNPDNTKETDVNYRHLIKFLRYAPQKVCFNLWRYIGKETLLLVEKRGQIPVYLSTSGMQVNWLHIRLDSHAELYSYAPFTHDTTTKIKPEQQKHIRSKL